MAYTKLLALESTFADWRKRVMGMVWLQWEWESHRLWSVRCSPTRKAKVHRLKHGRCAQCKPVLLERRIAGAGGKGPAAANGLLLAARGGGDEVLEGVGCGGIPGFRQRRAARERGHRRGRVSERFLRVANQHRRSRIAQVGQGFLVAHAHLG